MAYGTALASFNVEEFGTERVARLTADEISARVADLQRMTRFDARAAHAARVAADTARVAAGAHRSGYSRPARDAGASSG